MTAATYAWRRLNVLENGDFEVVGGTFPNKWTKAETVTAITSGQYSGSNSAHLEEEASILQSIPFVQTHTNGATTYSRRMDEAAHHLLDFYAKPHTSTSDPAKFKITLELQDATPATQFTYNWFLRKWVSGTTEYPFWLNLTGSTWTHYNLPKIVAPVTASTSVADTWSVKVKFETDATSEIYLDEIRISQWASEVLNDRLGPYAVISNGQNYPVKYDQRSGNITELSLNPPYETPNSGLPTETRGEDGSLTEEAWYGWAYTFYDSTHQEESGFPMGITSTTGLFRLSTALLALGSGGTPEDKVTLGFAAIELPNSENDPLVDNPVYDTILVYRTTGYEDTEDGSGEDAVENALDNGLVYFEGTLAGTGTHSNEFGNFVSYLADDDLPGMHGHVNTTDIYRRPAPGYDISTVYRNRLFVAGGPIFSQGNCAVSNESGNTDNVNHFVTGTKFTTDTDNATNWNRCTEGMLFQVDGEAESYPIERYIYPSDDSETDSLEKIYLAVAYEGTTATDKKYKIFPAGGKVQYSEEGQPNYFSAQGYFSLDGTEGEGVTGILGAGTDLLVMSRNSTYSFGWEVRPYDIGTAFPLSQTIGCIASRSTVEIRGSCFWLSDQGVVKRESGANVQIISNTLQGMFTDTEDPDYIVRDSVTQLAEDARGTHYAPRQQYLLAVRSKNAKIGCDMILAYNYFFESWDIFRLKSELLNWTWAVDDDGNDVLLFADVYGNLNHWDHGDIDGGGVSGVSISQTKGAVASATATSLTAVGEPWSAYDTGYWEGATVRITSGTGAGQERSVSRSDDESLFINEVWVINPDNTSSYELGGIDCEWNLKFSNLGLPGRVKRLKFVTVEHKQESQSGEVEVRVFKEYSSVDDFEGRELDVPTFHTGGQSRSTVGCSDSAGYNLRLQMKANGPQKPLEVRNINAVMESMESD